MMKKIMNCSIYEDDNEKVDDERMYELRDKIIRLLDDEGLTRNQILIVMKKLHKEVE